MLPGQSLKAESKGISVAGASEDVATTALRFRYLGPV